LARARPVCPHCPLPRLGELAFHSPALLGGQAEKKGLSCGSCHKNGRGNPDFQFEAVSGPPGTADVTSGLFSKVRADNTFNPLPIPDLARPEGADQVDRYDRTALAAFVKGQIEEEFNGDPTPEPVFDALLTYLEHIDGEASGCDLSAYQPQAWQSDWADAQMAALQARKAQPGALKAYYTRTARISLRRLHDRYATPEQADIRANLVQISRALEANDSWPTAAETDDLSDMLEAAAPLSLYSPERLSGALLGETADF